MSKIMRRRLGNLEALLIPAELPVAYVCSWVDDDRNQIAHFMRIRPGGAGPRGWPPRPARLIGVVEIDAYGQIVEGGDNARTPGFRRVRGRLPLVPL